jgi:hypothetical protein
VRNGGPADATTAHAAISATATRSDRAARRDRTPLSSVAVVRRFWHICDLADEPGARA